MARTILAFLLWLGCFGAGGRAAPPPDASPRLRLGFNSSMFVGVNENDARASVRALAAAIARDNGITADADPQLFTGTDSIAAAVDGAQVDAIGLTTPEFKLLVNGHRFDRFLFSVRGDDPTDEYILLVSRSDRLTQLDELHGKTLTLVAGPRLSLALPWLEVTLARAGLPEAPNFFRLVTHQIKPSRAILDTYFHKCDACITTRASFATMTELNPQIGTRLQILAFSPPLIPSLFAFRTGFDATSKDRVIRLFTTIHHTVAGQQALTIFQVTQVVERPFTALAPSFALLEQFARERPALAAAYTEQVHHGSAASSLENR